MQFNINPLYAGCRTILYGPVIHTVCFLSLCILAVDSKKVFSKVAFVENHAAKRVIIIPHQSYIIKNLLSFVQELLRYMKLLDFSLQSPLYSSFSTVTIITQWIL